MNLAVAACHEAGTVSSATLVVNGGAEGDAARIAGSLERLGVGLHFNLTLGRPVSDPGDVRSLVVEGGRLASRSRLLLRWLLGRLDTGHVRRELLAQLARFTDLGLDMTHIDSHQHVHMIPPVWAAVSGYCRAERLPTRMPWRGPEMAVRPGPRRRLRSAVLGALLRGNAHRTGADLLSNRGFASVFDVCDTPDQVSRSVYVRLLASVDVSPFELMVHPALVDDSLRKMTKICDYSAREYGVLSETNFHDLCARDDLRLVSYREIVNDS